MPVNSFNPGVKKKPQLKTNGVEDKILHAFLFGLIVFYLRSIIPVYRMLISQSIEYFYSPFYAGTFF
jgi:hypothetical protein